MRVKVLKSPDVNKLLPFTFILLSKIAKRTVEYIDPFMGESANKGKKE